MRILKKAGMGLVRAACPFLFIILIYRLFIGPINFAGGVDAVSSASVILDAPSGQYIVLLNETSCPNEETVNQWEAFFQGESILILHDISCLVAYDDPSGVEMAYSYVSRLPENQMTLRKENSTLVLSKADLGLYDVIVMSLEFAEIYNAETAYMTPGARVIHIGGDEV